MLWFSMVVIARNLPASRGFVDQFAFGKDTGPVRSGNLSCLKGIIAAYGDLGRRFITQFAMLKVCRETSGTPQRSGP
jgi:hypothetical protein